MDPIFDIAPVELAYSVLHSLFNDDGSTVDIFMNLASSGTHVHNPYHNLTHELQHVYWSNACAVNSGISEPSELRNLAVASMFHDHGHSGGRQPDYLNIQYATKFIPAVCDHLLYNSTFVFANEIVAKNVITLIECTQFDYPDFHRKPETRAEMCMRDADLMAIYTEEGRTLLLGLSQEVIGKAWHQMRTSERNEALEKNADFLRSSVMYTEYGERMKDFYLEGSLKAFADLVKHDAVQ